MVHGITRVSISVPSNRSRSGMVHGPGIGTGGVEAPWVGNFFKGLYMYIYTDDATRLDPPHPHSRATRYTRAPRRNVRAPRCAIVRSELWLCCCAWVIVFFCEDGMYSHCLSLLISSSGMIWRVKVFELFLKIYLTVFVLAALIAFHSSI